MQARLLFGCALVNGIHIASLHTLTNPTWSPSPGVTLMYLQLPGGSERVRLPAISYDECIMACQYLPWIRAVHFSYTKVLGDERQDNSFAKLGFIFKVVRDSDEIRGNGHVTSLTLFGDDDQVSAPGALELQCAAACCHIPPSP